MRLPRAFSPIEPGERDLFAFDFTGDVGATTLVSTTWTCVLAPSATGTDPSPQDRVISSNLSTQLEIRNPVDDSLTIRNGFFSVGFIGDCPTSMVGSDYVLEATVVVSDGRILKLNATVRCQASGYS